MGYYEGEIACDIFDDEGKVCMDEAFVKVTISDVPQGEFKPRYYYMCAFHAEREFPLNHNIRIEEDEPEVELVWGGK